ncbi:hypothetical protein [Sphingomonas sp. UYP23]
MTQVIQADRDRLADHLNPEGLPEEPGGWVYSVRHGDEDSYSFLKLLASHRLAHTARPDAGDEVERVAEAIGREDERIKRINESAAARQPPSEHVGRMEADKYLARAAIAAMREGVDRGMVEREGHKDAAFIAKLVDEQIEREGSFSSFMIRAGLLQEFLAALSRKGG